MVQIHLSKRLVDTNHSLVGDSEITSSIGLFVPTAYLVIQIFAATDKNGRAALRMFDGS